MEEQLKELLELQRETKQQLQQQTEENRKLTERLDAMAARQLEQEEAMESKIAERLGQLTAPSAAREEEAMDAQAADPEPGQQAELPASDLLQRLIAVQEQIALSLNRQQSQSLVDLRGLAKPSTYSNKEEDFHEWRRKFLNYVGAVPGFKGVKEILNFAAEHDETIGSMTVRKQFASVDGDTIANIEQQIYTILDNVTTGESQDIVSGSGDGSGFEAWRRLNLRWDPHTASRSGSLLTAIMNPGRSTLANLQGSIEKLEDIMRRYCTRKDHDGSLLTLPNDIRMFALKALCPEDLARHLDMNQSRFRTYDDMRREIINYCDNRGHHTCAKPSAHHPVPGGESTDVDSLVKRKGDKGKGKGDKDKGKGAKGKSSNPNKDKECHHCGKKGHIKIECWWKDTPKAELSKSQAKPKAKGKAKGDNKGKGKGDKGAHTVETTDEQATVQEEQDVCHVSERPEVVGGEDGTVWLRCMLDSGCGRTVFPREADYGVSRPADKVRNMFTASGELIQSGDAYKVTGQDEAELQLVLNGVLTDVRKPLIAAGAVAEKGNDMIISDAGSYVTWAGSAVQKEIRKAVQRILEKHAYVGTMPLYKENGVYYFYVKLSDLEPRQSSEENRADLCPADDAKPINSRQGKSL